MKGSVDVSSMCTCVWYTPKVVATLLLDGGVIGDFCFLFLPSTLITITFEEREKQLSYQNKQVI